MVPPLSILCLFSLTFEDFEDIMCNDNAALVMHECIRKGCISKQSVLRSHGISHREAINVTGRIFFSIFVMLLVDKVQRKIKRD